MQARIAGLWQQQPWPYNAVAKWWAGKRQESTCAPQNDHGVTRFFLRCSLFVYSSHKHPTAIAINSITTLFFPSISTAAAHSLLAMDSARPHQRRFRRKFKLLTLRGRHTRNGSGSPENGDSNPLITNDTNDERSGEDTKEPSARFQPSEASQAIPRIQVELPPPTLTEQKLAQLKLEKTLLIQARRKHPFLF
jgi:hypothetical protein